MGELASKNSLARAEFLEILVRIGYNKYKETDRAVDYSSSLQLLLDDMFANYHPDPWQEFRDEQLWNNDMDRLIKANMDEFKYVYSKIFPKYGVDGFKECGDLF